MEDEGVAAEVEEEENDASLTLMGPLDETSSSFPPSRRATSSRISTAALEVMTLTLSALQVFSARTDWLEVMIWMEEAVSSPWEWTGALEVWAETRDRVRRGEVKVMGWLEVRREREAMGEPVEVDGRETEWEVLEVMVSRERDARRDAGAEEGR